MAWLDREFTELRDFPEGIFLTAGAQVTERLRPVPADLLAVLLLARPRSTERPRVFLLASTTFRERRALLDERLRPDAPRRPLADRLLAQALRERPADDLLRAAEERRLDLPTRLRVDARLDFEAAERELLRPRTDEHLRPVEFFEVDRRFVERDLALAGMFKLDNW